MGAPVLCDLLVMPVSSNILLLLLLLWGYLGSVVDLVNLNALHAPQQLPPDKLPV